MYSHPAMGRLLAQAKLKEAQSRMPPAHVLREAALERQGEAVTVLTAKCDDRREPPMPAKNAGGLRVRGTYVQTREAQPMGEPSFGSPDSCLLRCVAAVAARRASL